MKEIISIRRYELPEPFLSAGIIEFPVYKKSGDISKVRYGYLVGSVKGIDKFVYCFQIKRESEEIARSRFCKKLISKGFSVI